MIFGFELFFVKIYCGSFYQSLKKLKKNVLAIITFLPARQNEGENHMEKYFLTENWQGFGHDFLPHVRCRSLKIGIFGLEMP